MKTALLVLCASVSVVSAQFGNIFEHMFRQQQQQQQHHTIHKDSNVVEHSYDEQECNGYLCSDTLECVNGPMDCPCPFSGSQLKCVLPDKKSFVCISAPTGVEDEEEPRDCSFVTKAWKGQV